MRALSLPTIRHVAVPVSANALGEVGGADARNGRLAGGVDVHHQQHVGLVEGGEELLAQVHACGV